jgi:hypothetical protein
MKNLKVSQWILSAAPIRSSYAAIEKTLLIGLLLLSKESNSLIYADPVPIHCTSSLGKKLNF